jgi:CheY-like chemotaxis protein
VLIVDDDPAMRAVLRSAVARHADRVAEAADGRDALRAMRAECPDLVLLDLHLPPPDGWAVLAEMHSDPLLRAVATVVVTSAELDYSARSALGATVSVLEKSQLSTPLLLAAATQAAQVISGAQ